MAEIHWTVLWVLVEYQCSSSSKKNEGRTKVSLENSKILANESIEIQLVRAPRTTGIRRTTC